MEKADDEFLLFNCNHDGDLLIRKDDIEAIQLHKAGEATIFIRGKLDISYTVKLADFAQISSAIGIFIPITS